MNYLTKGTLRRTLVLTIASVAVIMTSLSGCKKSNPLGGGCNDWDKETDTYVAAVTAFSEDPSVTNCEKMRKAGIDYLKAAERCAKWHPEAVKNAKEAIKMYEDIDCSEFADN